MKKFLNVGLITCLMIALSGCQADSTSEIKQYKKELGKNYTKIEDNSMIKLIDSDIHDYFVRYHSQEMYKYSLQEFNKDGEKIDGVLIYDYSDVTKCSYTYFDKNWYMPNELKGLCDKDTAKKEIENIVKFMNPRIEEINKNKSTWNK